MTHSFKIVIFPDDGTDTLSIDIVPSEWIFNSTTLNSKACPFPIGPFTNSDIRRLHRMVKNTEAVDSSWPIHRVTIRGRAHTYEEACEAAEKLQYDRYAFSTDRESSVERRVREENEAVQIEKTAETNVDKELNDAMFELTHQSSSIKGKSGPEKANKGKKNRPNQTKDKKTVRSVSASPSSSSDDSYNSRYKSRSQGTTGMNRTKSSGKSSRLPTRSDSSSLEEDEDDATQITTPRSRSKKNGRMENGSPNQKETQRSRTKKRGRSENGSTTQKSTRRSRSQERGRMENASPISSVLRASSEKNRSLSVEPSGGSKSKTDRRARSSDAGRRMNENTVSASTTAITTPLAAVPEDGKIETLESLRQYITKIYNSLSTKLDRLHGAHVETDGKLTEIKDIIKKKPLCELASDDESQDDPNAIVLPVETKDDFDVFDTKLKDDKEYRHKIKKRIRYMVNKDKLETHNLSVIIRVFLSKNLIRTCFTAVQKTKTKDALKGTNFYGCLLGVHQQVFGEKMTENMFQRTLGAVINAAKDWDGGRLQR